MLGYLGMHLALSLKHSAVRPERVWFALFYCIREHELCGESPGYFLSLYHDKCS